MRERTHLGPDRPALVRAEGCYVWDRDGRRYLDATSGAFAANLGHTRPDLVEAMAGAAARLPHARPSTFDSEEAEAYREELLAAAGDPFARVLLTSSGSEAVEAAMKIAVAYQRASGAGGRTAIRSLAGHYHGATLGAIGVTGWEERRAPWGPIVPARRDGLPEPGDGSAALVAETIPAAGLGVVVPAPGAMAARRRACDAAGALWIADEVLTGFGRCGALFAWRRIAERAAADGSRPDAGALPDLVVFGKGAGAGFAALAGVLVSSRVAAALEAEPAAARFSHHQSYGGHPVACAVGRAVLRAFAAEGLDARTIAREESIAASWRRAAEGIVVRGWGALWGLAPIEGRASDLSRKLLERGVLSHLAAAAAPGGAVVIAPPLVADADVWATLVATTADAVAAWRRGGTTPSPGT
jgi:adenosylmethionine-8-amino-7-oxononanoate aminotransferase